MDISGKLGFEARPRSEGLENRSELVGFMRIAEDLATKRSAESGVSGDIQMKAEVIDRLRARISSIERGRVGLGREVVRTGKDEIDEALPWRGLPLASLHEITGAAGSGFAARLAGRCMRAPGALVWCASADVTARQGEIYGPGLEAFGIEARRLLLVRCADRRALLWAMEETLRCRAVACMVGEAGRLDLDTSRRLLLAAEEGGGLGLLLGGECRDERPNAALTRWHVAPARIDGLPAWKVDLWRIKGGAPGSWTIAWSQTQEQERKGYGRTFSLDHPAAMAGRAHAPPRPALGRALSG